MKGVFEHLAAAFFDLDSDLADPHYLQVEKAIGYEGSGLIEPLPFAAQVKRQNKV